MPGLTVHGTRTHREARACRTPLHSPDRRCDGKPARGEDPAELREHRPGELRERPHASEERLPADARGRWVWAGLGVVTVHRSRFPVTHSSNSAWQGSTQSLRRLLGTTDGGLDLLVDFAG